VGPAHVSCFLKEDAQVSCFLNDDLKKNPPLLHIVFLYTQAQKQKKQDITMSTSIAGSKQK
jgi:hypothetical protein